MVEVTVAEVVYAASMTASFRTAHRRIGFFRAISGTQPNGSGAND